MKTAIVVGTGAGGAMVAKELQGEFSVTILEAGAEFKPFPMSVDFLTRFRKTGLFLDERMISLIYPTMCVVKSAEKMIMVTGQGTGGSTTLSTGSAVRWDKDLKALGINLDEEFAELDSEVPMTTDHQKYWRPVTRQLYEACEQLGLSPQLTPKMIDFKRCRHCSKCVLGCKYGAKWDSRAMLNESIRNGAHLITDCKVTSLEIENRKVTAVHVKEHGKRKTYTADLIVLAAGGMGTPIILENSGIECQPTLSGDPLICVAGSYTDARLDHQILMPFCMERDGYLISPYMDYLSFFFNKEWRKPARNIVSLMIKLADSNMGASRSKRFEKDLTAQDKATFSRAIDECKRILIKIGIAEEDIFLGTVNAGHPGCMLPLTEAEADTFHHAQLPDNLYIADATILPRSMGNPPILTIMAMAKRVARVCKTAVS